MPVAMRPLLLAACSLAALASLGSVSGAANTTGLPDNFVKVKNGRLVIGPDCREFYFTGWNHWEVLELAAVPGPPVGGAFRGGGALRRPGREMITEVMDMAVANGLKVVRAWAHTMAPGFAMQTSPGHYQPKILEGMDWFMNEASIRGLKVTWVLVDNWHAVGGIDQYTGWAGKGHNDFFSDGNVKQLYKNTVHFLLTRTNTINGRVYKDDTSIMGWNLMNEGRCTGCGNDPMNNWIKEMCNFVKSVDPNHLVSIGYEGFYGPGSGKLMYNPQGFPAWNEGQNFIENAQESCIDYVAFHVWPDNWKMPSPEFARSFMESHINDVVSSIPGKPVILEEFGKIGSSTRNPYFQAAYDVSEKSARSGGPVMGDLFWHWYAEEEGPGQYGVHATDRTFPLIQAHAKVINGLFAGGKKMCPAK